MGDADVIVVGAGLAGLVAACEVLDKGRSVLIVDQENAANLGGQAFWSFGGLFFVDSPEQRRLGIHDSSRTGVAGLARLRRVRPAGGPLAPPVGARVRRLRRRREAQLAAGAGPADVRARRLGRTRRIRRPRARQLGATVPHHLGDRARDGRHLRPTAAGRGPQGPLRAPSSRRRADRRGRRGDRGARRGARTHVGGARCGVVTHRHRANSSSAPRP